MSNILIIKHGSLGDLIQANGAIKDIKNFYKNRKVFLLTAQPYSIFMSECPYLDGVIISSPHHAHYENAKAALEKDCHVMTVSYTHLTLPTRLPV